MDMDMNMDMDMDQVLLEQLTQDLHAIENLRNGLVNHFGQTVKFQFDRYEDGELVLKILLRETEHYASIAFNTIRSLDIGEAVQYVESQLMSIDSMEYFN